MTELGLRLLFPQALSTVRRSENPFLGQIPVPGQHGFIHQKGVLYFDYINNDLGLRSTQSFNQLLDHKKKVLFLGDSFTYGIGVNDNQTFSEQLNKKFYSADTCVINAGNEGTGTDYALRFSELYLNKIHPYRVILFFHYSDFDDNDRSLLFKRNKNKLDHRSPPFSTIKACLAENNVYNWVLSHSQLISLIKWSFLDVKRKPFITAEKIFKGDFTESSLTQNSKRITELLLKNLNQQICNAGSDFLICYTSGLEDARLNSVGQISTRELALFKIARQLNIPVCKINYCSEIKTSNLRQFYLPDGHWSAASHSYVANEITSLIH